MLKSLRDSVRLNPRFGSPINREYVKQLLNELQPQQGSLHYRDPTGVAFPLTTVPVKIPFFTFTRNLNVQIVPDIGMQNITIQNTQGPFTSGYYEQFTTGISGAGLLGALRINFAFTSPAINTIFIEIYVNGAPSGLIAQWLSNVGDTQALTFNRARIPDNSVLEFYMYCAAGAVTPTVRELSVDIEKVSLGFPEDAITVFAQI